MNATATTHAADWAARLAQHIADELATGHDPTGIYQSPDDRGDGYDIYERSRPDYSGLLHEAIAVQGITGYMIQVLGREGQHAAYIITVALPDEMLCGCTHQGNWGPWYHISLYRRSHRSGAWVFVERLGGHYRRGEIKRMGLPIGRPAAGS